MKKGIDIAVSFDGLELVHHNLPGKKLAQVILPQHLLILPLQGEIRVSCNELGEYVLGPGRMLYIPSNQAHSFLSSETSGERLIAMVSPSFWRKLKAGKFRPTRLPVSHLAKEILFFLLLNPKTKHARSLTTVLVETLSESIAANVNLSGLGSRSNEHLLSKVKDARLRLALEFMKKHCSEFISIPQIAAKFGMSPRSFNRFMLTEIGVTPKQALIDFRIDKAQSLILAGQSSVTEVAYSVGYNSLGQFISAFRRKTGQLPFEYMRFGKKRLV
jgi:AraC-like DNA-binding protein